MTTAQEMNLWSIGKLPGLIGVEICEIARGFVRARLTVRPELLAPNGYLHAATVIALADTACGYGTIANLPEGSKGFTTIELKANFIGTALDGTITCEARLAHGGRTTQVWDAEVRNSGANRVVALFRCTQMILSQEEAAR